VRDVAAVQLQEKISASGSRLHWSWYFFIRLTPYPGALNRVALAQDVMAAGNRELKVFGAWIDPLGSAHFYRLKAQMRTSSPDQGQLAFPIF
jgi:hypothetical protein